MALRIAVGGFMHESATFVEHADHLGRFRPHRRLARRLRRRGDARHHGRTEHRHPCFVDEVRKAGHEVGPDRMDAWRSRRGR